MAKSKAIAITLASEEQHARLKQYAKRFGTTVSGLIRAALADYLKKRPTATKSAKE
jgi:predicted DNA-binding protein